jgi:spore coat polysaccharide biosynthesis protein SpsF
MIDQVVAAFNGCPPPTGFRYCDGYGGKPSPTPLPCGEAKASAEAGTAYDFAANRLPPPWKRTFPIGLDIEVCRFAGLERAWRDATLPYEREHVMPYFYDQQGRYNIVLIDNLQDYGDLRWTVDTPEDLELVRQMFAYFKVNDLPDRIGPDRKSPGRSGLVQDDFSWLDVLDLVEAHPELSGINAHVRHKTLTEVDKRSTVT